MPADFAAIDFETTGFSPNSPQSHRVIEIGIVRFSLENGISAEYESVINPQRDIGPFEIHRISAGEASGAPTFTEVASDVAEMLNGARLIAHNKNFDLRFLRSELDRASISYTDLDAICTMELVGMIKPNGPRRLTECCELLGIEVLDAHRALNDAKMSTDENIASHFGVKIWKSVRGNFQFVASDVLDDGRWLFYIDASVDLAINSGLQVLGEGLKAIGWNVKDTSTNKPYDFHCTSSIGELYVEVKGTTSNGEKIILTRGEVEHHQSVHPNNALIIVSGIELVGSEREQAEKGNLRMISPWDIAQERLTVVTYTYDV